jgi:hypothetical protein
MSASKQNGVQSGLNIRLYTTRVKRAECERASEPRPTVARTREKKTTARNEQRSRRLLEEYFGKDRTLESITPGDGDD